MVIALPGRAHEVSPAIADMSVGKGVLRFDLRYNAEAFLAGIDLDGISDTNETDQSAGYDALRALSEEALRQRISATLPLFLLGLVIETDTGPVELALTGLEFADPGDTELPRFSLLALSGEVPRGAGQVTVFWGKTYGGLVLRQQGVDEPFTGLLQGGESSPPIRVLGGGALSGWQSFAAYIPVGFDHILPKGLDHILFVLGLFFLSLRLRPLLWQISAFTLAHTVTLALGALGWVSLPGAIVEPLIAASIVYVAIENVLSRGLSRLRPFVVFGFGLLHGLGFAAVLGEFGLPEGTFVPALLGFNVGVEFGQLTVIALAFLAVGLWFGQKPWYRARIATPASLVIAGIGAYWVVERVFL